MLRWTCSFHCEYINYHKLIDLPMWFESNIQSKQETGIKKYDVKNLKR